MPRGLRQMQTTCLAEPRSLLPRERAWLREANHLQDRGVFCSHGSLHWHCLQYTRTRTDIDKHIFPSVIQLSYGHHHADIGQCIVAKLP